MKKRRYELRRRAESRAVTRRKIVEAAVKLHETVGPRATTISAIAEEAGVQRLTVYRHFPDDAALFGACSAHWFESHPAPDAAIWLSLSDWRSRCRAALAALYSYYRRNAGMLGSVFHDADMPVMKAPMQGFFDLWRRMRDDILDAMKHEVPPSKPLAETISHALGFTTWQSLAASLSDVEIVALVLSWLDGVVVADTQRNSPRA